MGDEPTDAERIARIYDVPVEIVTAAEPIHALRLEEKRYRERLIGYWDDVWDLMSRLLIERK